MMRALAFAVPWLAIRLLAQDPSSSVAGLRAGQAPFFEARKQQTEYFGPGREDPEPEGLEDVAVAYFGPADPAHPEGGDLWRAVSLAFEEANREGGYRGLPFRLIPCWSDNPWSGGAGLLARTIYEHRVWAIIGGIDGPSTHLAEQVAVKARVPIISPAATDKTANLANVPWIFSSLPGDHLLAAVIGRALIEETAGRSFVILAATDHDSHRLLVEVDRYLGSQRAVPTFRFEFRGGEDPALMVRQVAAARPAAVILLAGARESASVLELLRKEGYTGKVFGGPAMGRRLFLEHAEAEGIVFPLPGDAGPANVQFARDFAARFGVRPDYVAAHAYESARMLAAAIRAAGLNRARIRDALRDLSPWTGAAVHLRWDPLGQNQGAVVPATIRKGVVSPVFPPVLSPAADPFLPHSGPR